MNDLQKNLLALGLNETEAAIFLALVKHGKATAARVATSSGLNRTTTYSILKQLVKKGIATEDLGAPTLEFIASSGDLLKLIEKEQAVLEEKKRAAQGAAAALKDMEAGAQYAVPKIQFIPEERMQRFFDQQIGEWNESMLERDKVLWGFQESEFAQRYERFIREWSDRSPKTLKVQLLTNLSPTERELAMKKIERREVKFWKDSVKFTATNWIMGDYVVMFVISKKPNYLVEIHDRMFAENLREVYKGVWESLK